VLQLYVVSLLLAIPLGYWNHIKGRSGMKGFLLSAALGPIIGMIVIGVRPRDGAALEQRAIEAGNKKRCHACAELAMNSATICPRCGTALAATAA
jgi:hypothetical protein